MCAQWPFCFLSCVHVQWPFCFLFPVLCTLATLLTPSCVVYSGHLVSCFLCCVHWPPCYLLPVLCTVAILFHVLCRVAILFPVLCRVAILFPVLCTVAILHSIFLFPCLCLVCPHLPLHANKCMFVHRILDSIGMGNFGSVYKALWTTDSGVVEVAAKSLLEGAGLKDREKFLQEAAIMGQFRHENIVKLHGIVNEEQCVSHRI